MGAEIGIRSFGIVANKVNDRDDELFIKEAFPNNDILVSIPFSDAIRRSDKPGKSVFEDLPAPTVEQFESLFAHISKI